MRICVYRTDSGLTDMLRRHIDRRMRFALTRFDQQISVVRVWAGYGIVGPAGPKAGCRAEVGLTSAGCILVQTADTDLFAAVSWVAERAGMAVSRELRRQRDG